MPTSTDGLCMEKPVCPPPSGALSPRQKIALVRENRWWPFDRVDGALLQKMHRQAVAKDSTQKTNQYEDALL